MRIMYVFFLGVVPFLILASLFLYYWKQNKPFFISKTPNLYVESNEKIVKPKLQISHTTLISCTNPHVYSNCTQLIVKDNDGDG